MLVLSKASDFWDFAAESIIPALGILFWVALAAAILVRVVIALIRRRPDRIRAEVLDPIARSAAVQSEAYGWKPYDGTGLSPKDPPTVSSDR